MKPTFAQRLLKKAKQDTNKGLIKSIKNFLGLYEQGENIVEVFDV